MSHSTCNLLFSRLFSKNISVLFLFRIMKYKYFLLNLHTYFNLQALYKKALTLGLHGHLQRSNEVRHILRQIMALALLPADEIRETYLEIVDSLTLQTRIEMKSFFAYYEVFWLLDITPEIFSVYGLLRRTNNVLESYHRTLKQKLGVHSNIWMFTSNFVLNIFIIQYRYSDEDKNVENS